jgi:hypothetical protein
MAGRHKIPGRDRDPSSCQIEKSMSDESLKKSFHALKSSPKAWQRQVMLFLIPTDIACVFI